MKITDISPEVLLEIVIHLDNYEIICLSQTNQFFRNLLSDHYISKRLERKKQVMDTYSKQLIAYTLDKNYFMIDMLLKQGADPNKLFVIDNDFKKKTTGHILDTLIGGIMNMGSLQQETREIFDNIADGFTNCVLEWSSPFTIACEMGDTMAMELMLKYGADVNQSTYIKMQETSINKLYGIPIFGEDKVIKGGKMEEISLLSKAITVLNLDTIEVLIKNSVDFTEISAKNMNVLLEYLSVEAIYSDLIGFTDDNPFMNILPLDKIQDLLELFMKYNIVFNFNEPIDQPSANFDMSKALMLGDIARSNFVNMTPPKTTLLDEIVKLATTTNSKTNYTLTRFADYLRKNGAKSYRELQPVYNHPRQPMHNYPQQPNFTYY